jgi:hypothetical protein
METAQRHQSLARQQPQPQEEWESGMCQIVGEAGRCLRKASWITSDGSMRPCNRGASARAPCAQPDRGATQQGTPALGVAAGGVAQVPRSSAGRSSWTRPQQAPREGIGIDDQRNPPGLWRKLWPGSVASCGSPNKESAQTVISGQENPGVLG